MTLSAQDAHRWLRPEVDELSPKVSLVLGHVLIQGRRQPWVVPGCRLGIVIYEVHSRSVRKTHLPAARQRTQLGHRLLLDLSIGIVLTAIHADVLLPAGVHPGRRPRVVVNKVGPPFGCPSLLPAWWKLSGPRTSGTGMDCCVAVSVGSTTAISSGTGLRRRLRRKGRRVSARPILWQRAVLVPLSLDLGGRFSFSVILRLGSTGGRPVPTRGSCVVIDVVGPAKIVFPAFPASWETSLCILEWAQLACLPAGSSWWGERSSTITDTCRAMRKSC